MMQLSNLKFSCVVHVKKAAINDTPGFKVTPVDRIVRVKTLAKACQSIMLPLLGYWPPGYEKKWAVIHHTGLNKQLANNDDN